MPNRNFITTALLVLLINNAGFAQDTDTANAFVASYPQDGSWFAMDDSNTGFFIDVQNGRIGGAYFGFDSDGENVWLLFNGELQGLFDLTSPQIQIGWQVETTLTQSANGGCIINCNDTNNDPVQVSDVATLLMQFEGRSHGQFSINGGEVVEMIPLYFGTSAIISDDFAGLTAQPDLRGVWAVVVGSGTLNDDFSTTQINLADTAGIIEIGEQEVLIPAPTGVPPAVLISRITRAPIIRDTAGLFPEDARIECNYLTDTQTNIFGTRIDCLITGGDLNIVGPDGGTVSSSPIQLMSDSRFLAFLTTISDEGVMPMTRLEAFRVSYD